MYCFKKLLNVLLEIFGDPNFLKSLGKCPGIKFELLISINIEKLGRVKVFKV